MKYTILLVFLLSSISLSQDFWDQCKGPSGNVNFVVTSPGNELFAGTNQGLFKSINNGLTWEKQAENFIKWSVQSLVFKSKDEMYLASKNALYSSADGNNWNKLTMGADIGSDNAITCLELQSSGDLFVGTEKGVYCFSSNTQNLSIISDENLHVYSLTVNSSDDLFIGTNKGIYMSSDKGDPWFLLNDGINLNHDQCVSSLKLNSEGELFASVRSLSTSTSNYGSVYRSSDNGENWTQISDGLGNNYVTCLGINHKGEIFAGTFRNGVYRSQNNGDSWTQIKNGLNDLELSSISFKPGGYIFVGTNEGVFKWLSKKTLFVPTDYKTIQEAISNAEDGNTIIIEEGTYYQQFSYNGKAVKVGSRYLLDNDISHISRTIIDGEFLKLNDNASIVYFNNGEDSNSVLCGLTLQNGMGTKFVSQTGISFRYGGAVSIASSGAVIRKNIIKNCKCVTSSWTNAGAGIDVYATPESRTVIIEDNTIIDNMLQGGNRAFGGAIQCEDINGQLVISKNIIKGNTIAGDQITGGAGISVLYSKSKHITISNNYIAQNICRSSFETRGGGIFAMNLKIDILNNIIKENKCLSNNSYGGGIGVGYWSPYPAPIMKASIINNTIVSNKASLLGGGIRVDNMNVEIMNNIIRDNFSQISSQINLASSSNLKLVEYNNVEGGFDGWCNIDADPMFCDQEYCILDCDTSPCIDMGNPDPRYNDRVYNDVPIYPAYGTVKNDQGAFGGPHSKWFEMSILPDDPAATETPQKVFLTDYSLLQNYPNPFNPTTTIGYSIPADLGKEYQNVRLVVYDVLGREVEKLVNEKQEPGEYLVEWNANNFPCGIYFCSIQIDDYKHTKKMILLK